MSKLIDVGPYVMNHGAQPRGRRTWEMQLEHNTIGCTFAIAKLRQHFGKLIAGGNLSISETGWVEISDWWCDARPVLERVARAWAKFDQPHWDEYHWAILNN